MIEVPWMLERHDCENDNALQNFLQRNWGMPWLEYLTEHSINVEVDKYYNPATMMYVVTFKFDLDPKKETYYRIKYGSQV